MSEQRQHILQSFFKEKKMSCYLEYLISKYENLLKIFLL